LTYSAALFMNLKEKEKFAEDVEKLYVQFEN
jgi:hypothetical protein